jgi:hypothetical protein
MLPIDPLKDIRKECRKMKFIEFDNQYLKYKRISHKIPTIKEVRILGKKMRF